MGSGIGLALGATYMMGGMAQATADHQRAARIAQAAGGGFSETMLQREMDRMDPAALRVARAHDNFADDSERGLAESWPSRFDWPRRMMGRPPTARGTWPRPGRRAATTACPPAATARRWIARASSIA